MDIDYGLSDAEKWEGRGDIFREFLEKAEEKDFSESGDLGTLKALFLGERAMLNMEEDEELEVFLYSNRDLLESLGYRLKGSILYDPLIVEDVVKNHEDIFGKATNTDQLMDQLEQSSNIGKPSGIIVELKFGLLLGFPLSSVKHYMRFKEIHDFVSVLLKKDKIMEEQFYDFEYEGSFGLCYLMALKKYAQELGISASVVEELEDLFKDAGSENVDICGIQWVEYGLVEPDSVDKQNRLRDAFVASKLGKPRPPETKKKLILKSVAQEAHEEAYRIQSEKLARFKSENADDADDDETL